MGLGTDHPGRGPVCSDVGTAEPPAHPTQDLVP